MSQSFVTRLLRFPVHGYGGKRIEVANDRENEHSLTSLDDLKFIDDLAECHNFGIVVEHESRVHEVTMVAA